MTVQTVPRILAELLVAAAIVLGLGSAGHADTPPGSIEAVVDAELPASGVPGVAWAVVDDGATTAGARGVVRAGGDRAVTPDTPFVTGSISKSFTALAVMQLVEAGEVDLDATLSQYLDGVSGRPAGAVTIRQLLSHTSGFSTLQGNAPHAGTPPGRDALAARADLLATTAPASAPGAGFAYSNANYVLLGRLVEVVAGQDYQSYVTDNILEPVGMDDSFVADGDAHESMATGHRPWFTTKRALPDTTTDRATAPQGGIIASADDLARYLAMMLNGQDDILSAAGKARMMRPASPASPFYGFGWFLDPDDGTVWHSGSTPGFETLATMVPSERTGVVVLANAGSGIGFGETTRLRTAITATALGLDDGGEGPRWSQRALFIGLVLLPIAYLLSMAWAWRHRAELRAKSGPAGLFSLWFPLVTTLAAAWVMLSLVPTLFGAPLATLALFQPDLGLLLIASAITGVLWAGFRLAVASTRGRPPA